MSENEAIPPFEQAYLLNTQLIASGDQLRDAVITVGGQAVQYWVSYFHDQYGDELPDERLVTSIDVDYSANKHDVNAIAHALHVDVSLNDKGNPPSVARFLLIDSKTKEIKQVDGRYFSDPEDPEMANTVDVIDWPAGFELGDFSDKKLLLNTEPFLIALGDTEEPVKHEKVRVLNPIACIKSRFANLKILRRRRDVELARINALKIPCFLFILEMFDERDFRVARDHFMNLYALAWDENYLRLQTELRDAKHNVSLLPILEKVHEYLVVHFDDFELPEDFVHKDLPNRLRQLRKRSERYVTLGNRVKQKQ